MWTYVSAHDLYHHGIKGQKWGVRRFQNKDGSLTSAGKKRYDDYDSKGTKVKHRDKLIAKYRSEGLSEKNAQYMADRRIETEKFVAAAAGITVAAATAYVVDKNIKYKADKIIKSGSDLQRISANTNLDRSLYVSFNKKDNIKYRGLYGIEKGSMQNLKQLHLKTNDMIKIPSRKKAEDAFVELYKKDPEFKKTMMRNLDYMKTQGWLPNKLDKSVRNFLSDVNVFSDDDIAKKVASDSALRKDIYDAFNFGLANTRGDARTAATKFYSKLKEMGYDAVTDINDQKYSGYKTKNPTIIFNSAKIGLEKVEELSKERITKDFLKSKKILRGQEYCEEFKQVAIKTGSILGASAVSYTIASTATINKYRHQHPNTKLTDKEILEMLQKQQ